MRQENERQQRLFERLRDQQNEAQRLSKRAKELIEESHQLIEGSHEYMRRTEAKHRELLAWLERVRALRGEPKPSRSKNH